MSTVSKLKLLEKILSEGCKLENFLGIDIKGRYNEIKGKYPTLLKEVRVHMWPHINLIFGPNSAAKTRYVFETRTMTTINDDGLKLLKLCDGTRTTEQLLYNIFENMEATPEQVVDKIVRFLILSKDVCNHIDFCESKSGPVSYSVTGSKEYITPIHFSIELTSRCNLRCKHCYRYSSPDIDDVELTYEEIIDILQRMHAIGARYIEVTGGEMFLHPRVKDIMQYIGDNFDFIGLLTNGTALTENMIEFLDKYKDKLIWSISLESYDEKTHDDFRGLKGSFNKTVQAIKGLTSRGHAVRVAMTVTDENIDHVEKTLEFVRNELKADWFGYNYVLPYGRGKDINWSIPQAQILKRTKEIDDFADQFPGFTNRFTEEQVVQMKRTQINCGAGWRTFTIGPNGVIRPCVLMEEGYLTLGNIKEMSIPDIMKTDVVKALYNLPWPLENTCGGCPNESFCKFCAYRAFITNTERVKQGVGLCKWAEMNDVGRFVNINNGDADASGNCLLKTCSVNE